MRDGNRRGFDYGSGAPFGEGQPKRNGTNGVHPEGMRTRSLAFDDIEDPIDLVAVQADDELINALSAGIAVTAPGLGGYDADDQVAAILAAWKAEVDSQPIPELVDLDTAVATVIAGRPHPRRVRHLAPVAAAAAFVVLAIGGVSVGSAGSEPGDVLWPVSKVLYSERAESVEAADRVEIHIAKAKQALVAGQPIVAAQELKQAEADLALIRPEEGKTELAAVQDFLEAKALETPSGVSSDPGKPLATDKARRVPAGAALTADPTEPSPPAETTTIPPRPVVPAPLPDPDPDPNSNPDPQPDPAPDVTSPVEETTAPPTTEPTDSPPPEPTAVEPPPATVEGSASSEPVGAAGAAGDTTTTTTTTTTTAAGDGSGTPGTTTS